VRVQQADREPCVARKRAVHRALAEHLPRAARRLAGKPGFDSRRAVHRRIAYCRHVVVSEAGNKQQWHAKQQEPRPHLAVDAVRRVCVHSLRRQPSCESSHFGNSMIFQWHQIVAYMTNRRWPLHARLRERQQSRWVGAPESGM